MRFVAANGDWDGLGYFGLKLGKVTGGVRRKSIYVVLAQAFNRRMVDGHVCGAGLLKIGQRHLLYVGRVDGAYSVCAGFLWIVGGPK